jgi:two-component system, cell cycle sensor histidine kinase and response regulator CckA
MMYGTVKQHNGHVSVFSKDGIKTTFTIDPLFAKTTAKKDAQAPFDSTRHGGETVLFAEDDPEVRAVLSEVLREYDYKVVECSDGEDAIRKFKEHVQEIDIAILDIVMPKQTGRAVYEEIRKLQTDLPVIFISGYNHEAIKNRGIPLEGLVFMSKPVMLHELLEKMRKVLDSRAQSGPSSDA